MPLIFPSGDDIKKIVDGWAYSQQFLTGGIGYVAPTVYLQAGKITRTLNYYSSRATALKQLFYQAQQPGFSYQTPSGYVEFKQDGTAQTFGINCDFFLPVTIATNIAVPYAVIRELISQRKINFFLVSMLTPDGKGPVWAVFSTEYLGIAATKVSASGDKLTEIDKLYRNLSIIKSEYNQLVSSLNTLSQKPADSATQAVINRLTQRRITMLDQIRQIKGVEITTGTTGSVSGIGFIPVAGIIILAIVGAGAWALNTWITERQKTERIRSAFNHQQYMIEEQKQITADYQAGKITKEQYEQSMKNIGAAIATAQTVAEQSSKPQNGLLDGAGKIVMWIAIAMIVPKVLNKTNG